MDAFTISWSDGIESFSKILEWDHFKKNVLARRGKFHQWEDGLARGDEWNYWSLVNRTQERKSRGERRKYTGLCESLAIGKFLLKFTVVEFYLNMDLLKTYLNENYLGQLIYI